MYKQMYKNFKPEILNLTNAMFKTLPNVMGCRTVWSMPRKEAKIIFNVWLREASKIYKVKCPKLVFEWNDETIDRMNPITNTITLSKISVVNLLHEFKHWLDYNNNINPSEKNARGWSVSLFNKVLPRRYTKAVEKELLLYE